MSLEQPDTQDSGPEVDQPVGQTTDAPEAELHDDDDDLDPDSQEQPEEEDDEIEVDGKKFALPKSAAEKLKSERMMQADYTQKTQAVAEERKAIAADREAVVRHQQEAQQYIGELAKVQAIDEQLVEYNKLDWKTLIEQDPQTAMLYQQQQRDLEAKRGQAVQAITSKQEANALSEQQNVAKQVQEADAYFKREIPGWSKERSDALAKHAIDAGIPAGELRNLVIKHPAIAKLLHRSELFDQLEKKQATAKPKPVVQEKPVTRITATRASAQRDPAKMSDAEWMKHRQEQSRKR